MPKQKIVVFTIFFCVCLTSPFFSQISSTSGPIHLCVPANITYVAPAGATSISWNFGPFGNFNNASGSFNANSSTTFNAVFSGVVNGSPASFTVPVFVHAPPVANFTILEPSNSCAPKTVTLTDTSVPTSPLQSWSWVYGDGNLLNSTSGGTHTYTYTAVGNWSITLIVTDISGCNAQYVYGPVSVISPPVAQISSNPPLLTGCSSSFNAAFSASNSTGSGALSYNWNFGNTQTSTQVTTGNITFTSQPNSYPVTLTVTAGGCSSTASVFVTVSPATLSATIPGTLCMNVPGTATVLSNQPYTTWNLGNSNTIYPNTPPQSAPVISIPAYAVAGIYTITVSAGNAPCIATPVTQTVFVDQVIASFTTTPANLGPTCNPTTTITFSNQSTPNASAFLWQHSTYPTGVSPTSTLANPTMTFSQGSQNPYTIFFAPFISTVSLIATSAAGCSATAIHTVNAIEQPTAWFNKNKKEGCAPLTVTFRDSSFFFPSNTITSYTWCNGATPPQFVFGTFVYSAPSNTHLPQQLFTYTAVGVYYPYLIIKTANGCTDISFIDEVIVSDPPLVSFSFSPTTVCPDQTVTLTNTTPNYTAIQHWHAESDGGFFSGCVNDPNPSWVFTQVGTHTISLSGYQNGCKGTYVSPQTITVKGPIVKLYYETNCTNRKSVDFFASLAGVQTATLNFGDNTTMTLTGNPSAVVINTILAHTYSATGNYTAILTGINAVTGCTTSIYTTIVTVRDVQASFTGPVVGCVSTGVSFNASSSPDVFSGCSKGYVWLPDNQPPVETESPGFNYAFGSTGIHTVTLRVKDVNGCTSTVTHTLRISGVTPVFSMNTNTLCLSNGTIQLSNTTSQLPDPVTNYNWNFGDGQTLSTSSQTPFLHTYLTATVPSVNYSVTLTASNSVGCVTTVTQVVQVFKPPVSFVASPQNICLSGTSAVTVTFTSQNSNQSYTLDYGVSPPSTSVTTSGVSSYAYSVPGVYNVIMTVKNAAGCMNSGSILVNAVQTPTAEFLFNSPGSTGGYNICAGNLVTFTNVSQPLSHTPTWNLGSAVLTNTNNVVGNTYNPVPPVTTTVAVSMTVNTGAPAYCTASVTKNFTIYVADASIALSKTVICLGESIQLDIINSTGVSAWIWDFGDATPSGTVYTNSVPPPPTFTTHAYTNYTATAAGNASISLIYWSIGEACKAATPFASIRIVKIDPDFKRNNELQLADSMHCIHVPDTFMNISGANSSAPLSYNWIFSDGFTSSLASPAYTFANSGVYQLSLTATGENNCKASTVKNMTIFPLPTATIVGAANCPDKPFQISGNGVPGVASGTWSPASAMIGSATFTTNSSPFSSTASASVTSDFSLTVTDNNGCISIPTSTTIFILEPPAVIVWDTTVVVGQPIPINAYEGAFTYTWTPVNTDLNCSNCYNPVSTSTVDITYSVSVEDTLHCSAVTSRYSIVILPKSSVDLPTAFTPNGDGINDVIYVGGWGIKKLNYFRIFNRYGQLLFETNDLKTGWDGIYRGVKQNMETYVYQVSVETYIDAEPLLKSGTFKLIK